MNDACAHDASVSAVKRLLRRLGEPPRFRRPDLAEKCGGGSAVAARRAG